MIVRDVEIPDTEISRLWVEASTQFADGCHMDYQRLAAMLKVKAPWPILQEAAQRLIYRWRREGRIEWNGARWRLTESTP